VHIFWPPIKQSAVMDMHLVSAIRESSLLKPNFVALDIRF